MHRIFFIYLFMRNTNLHIPLSAFGTVIIFTFIKMNLRIKFLFAILIYVRRGKCVHLFLFARGFVFAAAYYIFCHFKSAVIITHGFFVAVQ